MPSKVLEFDTTKFEKRMGVYGAKWFPAAKQAMKENVLDLERKSQELVPVDKAWLISQVSSGVKATNGKDIEGSVGYNTPYAASVHERMLPEIAPLGAQMKPGPTTRAKPGNEFGAAGGGYLRRPLRGKRDKYMKHIADAVKAVR